MNKIDEMAKLKWKSLEEWLQALSELEDEEIAYYWETGDEKGDAE